MFFAYNNAMKKKGKKEKSDLVKIAVEHESESMLDQSVAIESSDGKRGQKLEC